MMELHEKTISELEEAVDENGLDIDAIYCESLKEWIISIVEKLGEIYEESETPKEAIKELRKTFPFFSGFMFEEEIVFLEIQTMMTLLSGLFEIRDD